MGCSCSVCRGRLSLWGWLWLVQFWRTSPPKPVLGALHVVSWSCQRFVSRPLALCMMWWVTGAFLLCSKAWVTVLSSRLDWKQPPVVIKCNKDTKVSLPPRPVLKQRHTKWRELLAACFPFLSFPVRAQNLYRCSCQMLGTASLAPTPCFVCPKHFTCTRVNFIFQDFGIETRHVQKM